MRVPNNGGERFELQIETQITRLRRKPAEVIPMTGGGTLNGGAVNGALAPGVG